MLKKFTKASVLVLLMASSVSLTSCKKKDDAPAPIEVDDKKPNDKPKEKPDSPQQKAEKTLQGNEWTFKSISVEYALIRITVTGFKFTSATEVLVYDSNGNKNGKYSVSKDGTKITFDDSFYNTTFDIVNLDDDKLELKDLNNYIFKFGNAEQVEKERVLTALQVREWHITSFVPKGSSTIQNNLVGMVFNADGIGKVHYTGGMGLIYSGAYTLSSNGKKFEIEGKTYEILELNATLLKVKDVEENILSFENVERIPHYM